METKPTHGAPMPDSSAGLSGGTAYSRTSRMRPPPVEYLARV
jgi:hypothetical protein